MTDLGLTCLRNRLIPFAQKMWPNDDAIVAERCPHYALIAMPFGLNGKTIVFQRNSHVVSPMSFWIDILRAK